MKKLFAITVLMILALNAKADDIFATGYYLQNDQKVAAVYKNGEIIYTVSHEGINATPKTIVCDANKNIYWMINIYQGTSFKYTEVWKNDLLYVSTQGMSGVRIIDIYCLDDTLYYAGSYTNEEEIKVAAVWKGTDFTTHWQLGDGEHASFIYDAEVNPNTGVPYFCGYVTEGSNKATVWENNSILYKYEPSDYIVESSLKTLSIDNNNIYTLGGYTVDTGDGTWSFPAIWRNGEEIRSFDADVTVNCLCAFNGDYYYCWTYPHGLEYLLCKNNLNTVMQFPFNGSAGASRICKDTDDIYVVGLLDNKGCIWKNFQVLQQPENCAQLFDMVVVETSNPPDHSEWYYEILNDDGSVTYQHLECAADTTIGTERPKIIVRTNTIYDRDEHTEVTHEYVYERDGKMYWWNKNIEEFTVLYDLTAEAGDEWEIKVGTESILVHVDSVGVFEYDGDTRKMLHISDAGGLFSGDIVVGYGHLTNFFPERLMNRSKGYRVEGLRCYWIGDELVYHDGDEDCDAIYSEIHGVDEDGPSTGSGAFTVYPNPTDGILFVQTLRATSLPDQTYRITNLMGQTLLTGSISAETQQIDIAKLPAGMYFISVDETTWKFVKR